MLKAIAVVAALGVATMPAAAAVVTYDAFASFDGVNNPGGGFAYGQTDGVTLTPFTDYSNCFATVTCLRSSTEPALGVYRNPGAAFSFDTIDVPATSLFAHPGPGSAVYIEFTFPTTGLYKVDFTANLISNSTVTGVNISIFTLLDNTVFSVPLASLTAASRSTSYSFTDLAYQGLDFGFIIDNGGDYTFDSTAFTYTLTEVPEPATWSMLIAGFAMTGIAARRRPVARTA